MVFNNGEGTNAESISRILLTSKKIRETVTCGNGI